MALAQAGVELAGLDDDTLTYHDQTYPLRHVHYDAFDWIAPICGARFLVNVGTNSDGAVDRLWIAFEPTMKPAEYTRLSPAES